jgi:hypothetical protein
MITKNSTDEELMDAFEAGNNAGKGFGAGETTDTPTEAADREEYVILRRSIEGGTNNPGEPVFCEDGDDLIVIANVHGPWAVTVSDIEEARRR